MKDLRGVGADGQVMVEMQHKILLPSTDNNLQTIMYPA